MKIAVVSASGRGETDSLMTQAAEALQKGGVPLAGIVKDMSHVSNAENGCDMKVRVLPDGPIIQITQDLGSGSGACRLDPGAIASAVHRVETGNLSAARCFFLNKFGPEEAGGRGFISAIGQALDLDIPVVIGVGQGSRADFDAFSQGLATPLDGTVDAIVTWCKSAMAPQTPL